MGDAPIYRLVADRTVGRGSATAEELLECGHRVFFDRRRDARGYSDWHDSSGRRCSLNVKSRRCEECEMDGQ